MTLRQVVAGIAAWLAFCAISPAEGAAQGLRPELVNRAIDASVLVSVETPNGRSEGSGSVIDPRGYVLTNFHVVGWVHPFDGGVPGELFRADGRVTLAHASSARSEARPAWTGRVVRGDPVADLALIRIDGGIEGSALGANARFPSIPIASRNVELSERVYALGFPLGVRAVTLTSGQITGFDVDAEDKLAYLRVDAEFNPGNSGGMLLDERGELVGVPTLVSRARDQIVPIRKARPVERIPAEWRASLASGAIDDVQIENITTIGADASFVRSTGGGLVFDGQEVFFFRVPPGTAGTLRFEVDRSLEAPLSADAALISLARPRTPLRVAQNNALPILRNDPHPLVLTLTVQRRRDDGTQAGLSRIGVRLEAGGAMNLVATVDAPSEQRGTYERPPEHVDPPVDIGWSNFRLIGGMVIDPLVGQDYVGGGMQGLELALPFYVWDTIWPMTIALEYGARVGIGMWRDSVLFKAWGMLGARIGIGSPSFMIEIPLHYLAGIGSVEETLSLSAYGYETGLYARFHDFAIGVSWSESHRLNYSVLRVLGLSTGWYF